MEEPSTHCFIDLQCQACRRRYGYAGDVLIIRPCPYCGHKPGDKVQRDMRSVGELLGRLSMRAHSMAGRDLGLARKDAGLSVGQAAQKLGITTGQLLALEYGTEKAGDVLADKMNEVYGLNRKGKTDDAADA